MRAGAARFGPAQRVAIVGAGIAGLAAARHLVRSRARVVVFDKARGSGGRASTRRADGLAFDHGAQYFTCRHPGFRSVVSDWCARGLAAAWNARVVSLGPGSCDELPVRTQRYVGVPGMSALARDLARGLDVEYGTRIERVARSSQGWALTSMDGRAFDGFDRVLIATPAPQAVPLLEAQPDLSRRVAEVEMQPCHAVMVAFAGPLGVDFAGAFVAGSPLAWVARNGSKPGRGPGECWVLHTTPEWSAAHLDAPPEAVGAELLEALAAALGRELPQAPLCASHRWLLARAARPLGEPFLWDRDGGLGVCGDWTCGDRIEDAFRSGDRLARCVLGERSDAPRSPQPSRRAPSHVA